MYDTTEICSHQMETVENQLNKCGITDVWQIQCQEPIG